MTNTENYNLNLIEEHDLLDFAPFNENANIIDGALADLASDTAAIPTMQTAISNNATAITGLTSRVGEAETEIAANATAIASVQSENSAQWGQINTNHSDIVSAGNRITALESHEGDILKIEGQSFVQDPTIIKKLTVIGKPMLDQNENINIKIFSAYLPQTFTDFYVNASVYSKGSAGAYMPYVFNSAYIGQDGALVIKFGRIDDVGDILPEPTINDLHCYAEIIFI
jgi:hypothetical protein